jgi:hypothetical protein
VVPGSVVHRQNKFTTDSTRYIISFSKELRRHSYMKLYPRVHSPPKESRDAVSLEQEGFRADN